MKYWIPKSNDKIFQILGDSKLPSWQRFLWSVMILTALGTASYFIHWFINGFLDQDVSTTIESTTAPLSEVIINNIYRELIIIIVQLFQVHFPAVTICNDNQIRRSFLTDLKIYDNLPLSLKFAQEYIIGK